MVAEYLRAFIQFFVSNEFVHFLLQLTDGNHLSHFRDTQGTRNRMIE